MSITDLSDTIIAKSDQLNADDLIGASKTITVSNISRYQENGANCFAVNYEGDCGRPFKPCLTMRKIILFAWGEDGTKWTGRQMTLYCDPSVKWAGKEVGGVRISHMSDIQKPINVKVNLTRGKKQEIKVAILERVSKGAWDDSKLNKQIDNATKALQAGTVTHEQVINKLEAVGLLSDEQKERIRAIEVAQAIDSDLTMDDSDFE